MKDICKLILLLAMLTSCGSNQNLLPDYSKSAYEPILLIKNQILESTSSFNVELQNSHGGNYILYSKIKVLKDSVRIENEIHNNFYGTKSDTILNYYKEDFIKKLDYELKVADRQIKIAGNYQRIKVSINDSVTEFYTRQGLGLMGVLKDGQHTLKVAE